MCIPVWQGLCVCTPIKFLVMIILVIQYGTFCSFELRIPKNKYTDISLLEKTSSSEVNKNSLIPNEFNVQENVSGNFEEKNANTENGLSDAEFENATMIKKSVQMYNISYVSESQDF